MTLLPPTATRIYTLVPYTTLFRSGGPHVQPLRRYFCDLRMARDYPQAREIAEGGVQTGGRQEPGRVDRCLSQRGICCTDLPRRHGLAGKAAARHWRQRTSREADRELRSEETTSELTPLMRT